jgi:dTDP-D-glucose 4,6-dehydratase
VVASSFVFANGKVTVDEEVIRKIASAHTTELDAESEAYAGWMKTFAAVVNQCSNAGFREKLITLAIQKNIKGCKITVEGDDLVVSDN